MRKITSLTNVLRNQRGVAMVTVLFIGAVLAVTASTATFVTIQELEQGQDDRRASGALAYAEAGIDRAMHAIRSSSWASTVLSGCQNVPIPDGTTRSFDTRTWTGTIGEGEFEVTLEREDDCAGITGIPRIRNPQTMRLVSTGRQPTAKRVVEQIVEVQGRPLPIGLHGGNVTVNGSPGVQTVSLVSLTNIEGREQLQFQGLDLFYEKSDFYKCFAPGDPTWCIPEDGNDDPDMPAAAHAAGGLVATNGTVEHPYDTSVPCTDYFEPWNSAAPGEPDNDIVTQALWDGSAAGQQLTSDPLCGHTAGYPPTHEFTTADARRLAPTPELSEEDHEYFKGLAQDSGLYCGGDDGDECTINGDPPVQHTGRQTIGSLIQQDEFDEVVGQPFDGPLDLPIVYIEFEAGGPYDPGNRKQWTLEYPTDCAAEAAVVIVRNGSFSVASGGSFFGVIFVEDGSFSTSGSYAIDGTVVAQDLVMSGTGTFELSQCWLTQTPGTHLEVSPLRWRELDRPT